MDLCYEDLEKLHPEEVARVCEWLTEKVDGFSSKVKPEAKDVEEEVGPHHAYYEGERLLACVSNTFKICIDFLHLGDIF